MIRQRAPIHPYLFSLCLLLSVVPESAAFQGLGLRLGSISGQGWRIDGVDFELDWKRAGAVGWRLRIRQLEIPGLVQPLTNLEVICPSGKIDGSRIACGDASVRLDRSTVGIDNLRLGFRWIPSAQRLMLEARDLKFASGRMEAQFHADANQWQFELKGQALDLQVLKGLAEANGLSTEGWAFSGKLSPTIHLSGGDKGIEDSRWELVFKGVGFADPSEAYLGDRLAGRLSGRVASKGAEHKGEISLKLIRGEALTPGFYLSPADGGVVVQGRFSLDTVARQLEIGSLRYSHSGILEAGISGQVDLAQGLEQATFTLETGSVPLQALYSHYFQPILVEGPFANMQLRGTARLKLDVVTGRPSRLALQLYDVDMESIRSEGLDQPDTRLFGLFGVHADLNWSARGTPSASRLSWKRGHLLGKITLGAGDMGLELGAGGVQLTQSAEIPVLDGHLNVSQFALSVSDSGSSQLRFDGVLTPVSLGLISEVLNWPPMAGRVSGVIPGVSISDGRLMVAGVLLVRAFDGDLLIRHLQVQDLFGVFPILNADIELNNLDLEKLTGTFSFGKITGKLEGRIDGLMLEDWAPVAFNASFSTPREDTSKHRISQRAVDNISNLGGSGASGAISRSLLRFFDDFSYKRLGIRCRLSKGVCHMGGVAPAEHGYYLVEGGGIPRISIIGYNRQTDWNLLLDQLREISARGVPVAEHTRHE